MALPDKPFNFRGGDLTLDEIDALLALVDAGGKITRAGLNRFRRLLVSCSDWTDAEIGQIKISELPQVFTLIDRAEQDAAINPTIANA